MADNYLEKRMEEHLRRQAAAKAPTPRRQSLRAGEVVIKYPPMRVVVTDGCTHCGQTLIHALRSLGCRVAFTDPDAAAGRRLEQAEGAQYHPGADAPTVVARLTDSGDRPEAVIALADRELRFSDGQTVAIPDGCTDPDAFASFCCYTLHPTAAWMRR
ncbi:MAG: hypothetical protein K2J07_06155 [Muribaculaceae bacterium]|nr:hypothetical protein [Muribaculaceae bacterium]